MSLLGNVHNLRTTRLPPQSAKVPDWSTFFDAYLRDYQAHKRLHYPATAHVDHSAYSSWLESLGVVERASAQRVSDSGFFKGTTKQHIQHVVQEALDSGNLELRGCWHALFAMFLFDEARATDRLEILSVNFSTTFIRLALQAAASRVPSTVGIDTTALSAFIDHMVINANEIDGLDSLDASSGCLTGNIRTARNKLARMPDTQMPIDQRSLVVYVGDSATDYECLRAADIGIWMCDCAEGEYKRKFSEVFKPLASDVFLPVPITDFKGHRTKAQTCLWTTDLGSVTQMLHALSTV
ncbi:hypothetical protein LTR62_008625 [Meristemomyces frigidus]|uniref:Uncharacterized protein n=1 Tax=Meristemomyces frigidus TaxID=1508187 RepID=A0AAN7T9D2_9PEZI|nr:hypothetical protein LTR62_008625 [Meristemomyces frigidus]